MGNNTPTSLRGGCEFPSCNDRATVTLLAPAAIGTDNTIRVCRPHARTICSWHFADNKQRR